MVAPITGPTTIKNHVTGTGPGTRFDERVKYSQTKPHTLDLPYKRVLAYAYAGSRKGSPQPFPLDMSATNDSAGGGCCCSGSPPSQFAVLKTQATNLARAKFMGNLHESAMAGVNIAERVQAANMIKLRCGQLLELAKLVAGAALGKPKAWIKIYDQLSQFHPSALKKRIRGIRRDWRYSSKSIADLWLEFHFGWEPLVSDVHAAIDLLDKPVPTEHFTSHSRYVEGAYTVGKTYSSREYFKARYQGRARATVWGSFEVTNLDLYRAQRMGLTNPFVLGWELIPFSFVVDWFANVGEYLESFDGTLGLRLVSAGYSTTLKTSCDATRASYGAGWATTWTLQSEGVYFDRYTSLPSVTFGLRPAKALSVERGATAIALLTQRFGKTPTVSKPVAEMTSAERRSWLTWTAMPFTP